MSKQRKLAVYVLIIALLTGGGEGAYAQEVKKGKKETGYASNDAEVGDGFEVQTDNGKKRKKKYYGERKESGSKAGSNKTEESQIKASSSRKKQEVYYAPSKFKKRYCVSVIVPLFLDELVRGESVTFKEKVPDKAVPGLAFYQGVKMAADSLQAGGAMMDINIFDAGSFSESPDMLIEKRRLDSTDLIIGAVEQHDIPSLASYAKKKKINFVSALTNYDGWVKDNQYFTMLQPSVKSHCEFIIDDLSAKYAGQNVTLLYRTASLADDNAALYILNDLYSDVTFRKLLCNSLPDKEMLAGVFDTTRPNILAVSILDPFFADSILQALASNFPNTHFEVYGMPGWNEIPNLKRAGTYGNLTVNVPYPFNFDNKDSALISYIERKYEKEFGGKPSEMVWRGYETMFWYGYLLQEYGTIFNSDYKDISGAPFTKFRIKPRWDRNGSLLYLENKNIYMSVYQGGVYRTK
jgi:hypothetical protein